MTTRRSPLLLSFPEYYTALQRLFEECEFFVGQRFRLSLQVFHLTTVKSELGLPTHSDCRARAALELLEERRVGPTRQRALRCVANRTREVRWTSPRRAVKTTTNATWLSRVGGGVPDVHRHIYLGASVAPTKVCATDAR